MQSCIYEGRVKHVRREPVAHRFDYRLAMAYLDLDEIEAVVGSTGFFSKRRFAPASFLADDHRGGWQNEDEEEEGFSLAMVVRDHVEKATSERPQGPIRLLTQLRYFGHYFSPLNLYYCFSTAGEQIQAVVAEVSNTPWNERHHYVLHSGNQLPVPGLLRYQHPKSFHVSPFMGMEAIYEWQLNTPEKVLIAQIKSRPDNVRKVGELAQSGMFVVSEKGIFHEVKNFRATMVLHRRELSRSTVRGLLFRYPLMSTRILAAIYWQAFLLWKKKCPYFPHPQPSTTPTSRRGA